MNSFRLLISNVPHSKGEKLTRAAMESGCRGGTVLMGRGLARTNLAAVLGLGETPRDIIMMLVARIRQGGPNVLPRKRVIIRDAYRCH